MPIEPGDIYFVNLNPAQGREHTGHRPVVALSIDVINKRRRVIFERCHKRLSCARMCIVNF